MFLFKDHFFFKGILKTLNFDVTILFRGEKSKILYVDRLQFIFSLSGPILVVLLIFECPEYYLTQ